MPKVSSLTYSTFFLNFVAARESYEANATISMHWNTKVNDWSIDRFIHRFWNRWIKREWTKNEKEKENKKIHFHFNYFTIFGLLPISWAAVGYSVLLLVPKNPFLFGWTQCNEAVETPLPINVLFASITAFSCVGFILIRVGFNGRNIAPNMAQFNSIPNGNRIRFLGH